MGFGVVQMSLQTLDFTVSDLHVANGTFSADFYSMNLFGGLNFKQKNEALLPHFFTSKLLLTKR